VASSNSCVSALGLETTDLGRFCLLYTLMRRSADCRMIATVTKITRSTVRVVGCIMCISKQFTLSNKHPNLK